MNLIPKNWRLSLIIIITLGISVFIYRPISLPGLSKFGWICKVCQSPKANDLVALRLAGDNVVSLAKIIALPNDEVAIFDGGIEINQELLELKVPGHFSYDPKTNSPSEYFVVIYDQNLVNVVDFGRVKHDRLIGKVVFLW